MRRIRLTCAMKMDMPFIVGDKDEKLTLPDYAAAFAVKQGNAVYLDPEPPMGPSRAELERKAAEAPAGTLKQVSEESSQSAEEVKRPYGNAPKSAWVQYACQVDEKMTEERAEGMTKADLLSRYGERL